MLVYAVIIVGMATAVIVRQVTVKKQNTGNFIYVYQFINDNSDSARLYLNEDNMTFQFTYSKFSDYTCLGKCTRTDTGNICLVSDDGKYHYTFTIDGNGYVFDAENSSDIPSYRYSENGEPVVCVPDGAEFIAVSAAN